MGSRARVGDVAVATIMRPRGITGMQSYVHVLVSGLEQVGIRCVRVTPFDGDNRWLPVFAVRPLVLHRVNRNWSTRWYRHWHRAAVQQNLERALRGRPGFAVLAQDPLSARAALDARGTLGSAHPVLLVCHFNVSQADEFWQKGELDDRRTYERIRTFEEDVLQAVDGVVYVSEWARKTIEEQRGVSPRFSTVVHTGLPESTELPEPTIRRADLGLSAEDVVLVNVGTLEPRKNQIGLLHVFTSLAREHPGARLLFVGDGPDRGRLQDAIAELGLAGRVCRLGPHADVPSLLDLADVYVHYARMENLPVALLEAARARLPIAATAVGGTPEILERIGGTALSLEDADEAARALSALVVSETLRRQAGSEARRGYERHFHADSMVAGFRAALTAVGGP